MGTQQASEVCCSFANGRSAMSSVLLCPLLICVLFLPNLVITAHHTEQASSSGAYGNPDDGAGDVTPQSSWGRHADRREAIKWFAHPDMSLSVNPRNCSDRSGSTSGWCRKRHYD